jgi:hypothetical protein
MKRLAKEQPIDVGRVQRKTYGPILSTTRFVTLVHWGVERQTWGDKIEKTLSTVLPPLEASHSTRLTGVINLMIGPVLVM